MPRLRRNRSSVAIAIQPAVRCAIYTRKSTEKGLDRDFTSIDNQRQTCERFVEQLEQTVMLSTRYDDGGYSGGTTDRPALQQLIADIKAGEVDCVVAYKYDRLGRSMIDCLRMFELFDKYDVRFVSVTQQIDTSTSHGRMFVNNLLSFAQYERDVISERTRDKMHAARRRGKWTGGRPVLGYDTAPEGGKLLTNKDEAVQVRAIFEMYAENPSLTEVTQELNRRGWRQKAWLTKAGKQSGGGVWNRPSLRTLLSNPLYAGKQKLGHETFKGEHESIVPKGLFDRVQRLLAENRSTGGAGARNGHGFLLRGLVRCTACDSAMVPSWSRSRGRLYRYYRCSHAEKNGHAACPSKMIPADKVEQFVVEQIRRIGTDPKLQDETFRQAVAQVKAQRRGLRAEAKRIERTLVTVRADVERLVGGLTRASGPAAEAVAAELEKTQNRLATLESRQIEVREEIAALKAQEINRDDLTRALEEFDPIWDALLTPERERVMRLLIERIDYDGRAGEMAIQWRLAGFGQLADEVAS